MARLLERPCWRRYFCSPRAENRQVLLWLWNCSQTHFITFFNDFKDDAAAETFLSEDGSAGGGLRGRNAEPFERIPPPARNRAKTSRKIAFTFYDFARARFLLLEGKAIFLRGRAAALRRLAAVQRRFRFLDLCIRFGKIRSKVWGCSKYAAVLDFGHTNTQFLFYSLAFWEVLTLQKFWELPSRQFVLERVDYLPQCHFWERVGHPTQKPAEVVRRLVILLSPLCNLGSKTICSPRLIFCLFLARLFGRSLPCGTLRRTCVGLFMPIFLICYGLHSQQFYN